MRKTIRDRVFEIIKNDSGEHSVFSLAWSIDSDAQAAHDDIGYSQVEIVVARACDQLVKEGFLEVDWVHGSKYSIKKEKVIPHWVNM